MKLFKIFLMFIILSIVFFSSAYATESEQDLSNSLQVLSSLLSENEEDSISETSVSANSLTSSQVVTTSNSSENKELSISDIINIILIAVGLVLIFLAIAILLRAK